MKLVIIEGGDNLGKNLLIEGICKHYDYDNVCVRHFGKPPKTLLSNEVISYQFNAFKKEAELINTFRNDELNDYYDNIIIWNRSHLGEYVYSQMFRNGKKNTILELIHEYEEDLLHVGYNDVILITLVADPEFFLSKEDGLSLSRNITEKTIEMNLFKEIHDLSKIKNKMMIKVDNGRRFIHKDDILDQVISKIDPYQWEHNIKKHASI